MVHKDYQVNLQTSTMAVPTIYPSNNYSTFRLFPRLMRLYLRFYKSLPVTPLPLVVVGEGTSHRIVTFESDILLLVGPIQS